MAQPHATITRALCAVPLLAALSGAALPAWAAGATATATVDRTELQLGEHLVLTLTVTLGSGRSEDPRLPELSDFQVSSLGSGTSFNFINGRRSFEYSFRYALVPLKAGSLTIGPASVAVGDQVLRTQPITVRVTPAGAAPSGPAGTTGRDVFLTQSVDVTTPYVGQQIVHRLRFYRRGQVADASYQPPSFAGFTVERLGEQSTFEQVINGQRYVVVELRSALFAQSPGTLTIEPAALTTTVLAQRRRGGLFDDFFLGPGQGRQVTVRSEPLTLEVRPLPAPGRPAGFTGLVGRFELQRSLSQTAVRAKDSVTITVVLRGTGNVQAMAPPAPPEGPGFKLYEDKPVFAKEVQGERLSGSTTAKWALVPLSEGELTLPGVSLPYFDPESGAYGVTRLPPLVLQVLPAKQDEELQLTRFAGATTTKKAVELLGRDIMPLQRAIDAVYAPLEPRARAARLGLGLVLPPLGFVALWAVQRRRQRSPAELARARAARAYRQARQRLAAATDWATLAAATREYLADRLHLAGRSVTASEVPGVLAANGVGPELAGRLGSCLRAIEADLYAEAAAPPTELRRAIDELTALLREVERALG